YVFGAPNAQMWLLCVVQALAAAFLCAITLLLYSRSPRGRAWRLAGLALGTPIAFVVCLAIPDIFAGLVILAITLLAVAYDRMSRGVRSVGVFIGAAGIAFHASHLPIGLAMTLGAAGWMGFLGWRWTPVANWQWAW